MKAAGQPATGKVQFKIGGNTYKAKLKNGEADVKIEAVRQGR